MVKNPSGRQKPKSCRQERASLRFSLRRLIVVWCLLGVILGLILPRAYEMVAKHFSRSALIQKLERRIPPSSAKEIRISADDRTNKGVK